MCVLCCLLMLLLLLLLLLAILVFLFWLEDDTVDRLVCRSSCRSDHLWYNRFYRYRYVLIKMPSDESLLQQAEEWKVRGNKEFSAGKINDAISAYGQGIVECDRRVSSTPTSDRIKITLLSNRAMCLLKIMRLRDCVEDCTTALNIQQQQQQQQKASLETQGIVSDDTDNSNLRTKLLYRRAKAYFLWSNLQQDTTDIVSSEASRNKNEANDRIQNAAKDLLSLLQIDPSNKEAIDLLQTVRMVHKTMSHANTPVSKTLLAIQEYNASSDSPTEAIQQTKMLLGMLENDITTTALEIGRCDGVMILLQKIETLIRLECEAHDVTGGIIKLTVLLLQSLSQSCALPIFVRRYMLGNTSLKRDHDTISPLTMLASIMDQAVKNVDHTLVDISNHFVSIMAIYVRVLLHADRDDPNTDIAARTNVDYQLFVQVIQCALQFPSHSTSSYNTVMRATLDLLSTFTVGTSHSERDAMIRIAMTASHVKDSAISIPPSAADVRAMDPPTFAAHRKREYEIRQRNDAWAYERANTICRTDHSRTFHTLLQCAVRCEDHTLRREMIVVMGRILSLLDSDSSTETGAGDGMKIKAVLQPYMTRKKQVGKKGGVIIEELHGQDDACEEAKEATIVEYNDDVVEPLEILMIRAVLSGAILLARKDIGAWVLAGGWETISSDLITLVDSNDSRALCLVSEVLSSGATVESARPLVTNMISSGMMQTLMSSKDRDIRSGAASAIAKLGLSEKATDEGEIMGLLHAACALLEDTDNDDDVAGTEISTTRPSNPKVSRIIDSPSSGFATSTVERAVEMLTYLISNTTVKEELAAGFAATITSSKTALEQLVEIATKKHTGESLAGFGLATIFHHLVVTNLQLRAEMFEGKEVTMEQYDEVQKMGKTDEEKDLMEKEKDIDTPELCIGRVRAAANASVPRALVSLMDGASEHTSEQIVLAFSRMATEPSVRGILIQQGVLTACIDLAKNEESPTDTDTMKKIIRKARHCIAKILVTTNPALLTSSQRMGSVKPLILLIRDNKAKDLEQFEGLLAITNVGGSGDDARNRIVADKGLACFHFAMFSDHELIRKAATEAMCNMVAHQAMLDFLVEADHIRLFLAFASEYEANYECARAAAGGLAMATQDINVAQSLAEVPLFRDEMSAILECGRLEIMHRAFVILLNLVNHGDTCKQRCIESGLITFCQVYIENSQRSEALDFSPEEMGILPVTIELAKQVLLAAG
jgi:protein unc-45